jgi:hypothetical protein
MESPVHPVSESGSNELAAAWGSGAVGQGHTVEVVGMTEAWGASLPLLQDQAMEGPKGSGSRDRPMHSQSSAGGGDRDPEIQAEIQALEEPGSSLDVADSGTAAQPSQFVVRSVSSHPVVDLDLGLEIDSDVDSPPSADGGTGALKHQRVTFETNSSVSHSSYMTSRPPEFQPLGAVGVTEEGGRMMAPPMPNSP